MPYTLKVEGMEAITEMLGQVAEDASAIAALALYDGAGIVADAVSREAQSIRTAPFKWAKPGTMRDPSPEEKAILTENGAAGIAKFDKNGNFVGTAIGYNRSGYAMVQWNHMSSKMRSNYKIKGMKAVWSGKAYLKKGADGHAVYERGKGGLTNAKPVGLIANAINSGTSFMRKQPFIRKAISKSKEQANDAIRSRVQELVDTIINKTA